MNVCSAPGCSPGPQLLTLGDCFHFPATLLAVLTRNLNRGLISMSTSHLQELESSQAQMYLQRSQNWFIIWIGPTYSNSMSLLHEEEDKSIMFKFIFLSPPMCSPHMFLLMENTIQSINFCHFLQWRVDCSKKIPDCSNGRKQECKRRSHNNS